MGTWLHDALIRSTIVFEEISKTVPAIIKFILLGEFYKNTNTVEIYKICLIRVQEPYTELVKCST